MNFHWHSQLKMYPFAFRFWMNCNDHSIFIEYWSLSGWTRSQGCCKTCDQDMRIETIKLIVNRPMTLTQFLNIIEFSSNQPACSSSDLLFCVCSSEFARFKCMSTPWRAQPLEPYVVIWRCLRIENRKNAECANWSTCCNRNWLSACFNI